MRGASGPAPPVWSHAYRFRPVRLRAKEPDILHEAFEHASCVRNEHGPNQGRALGVGREPRGEMPRLIRRGPLKEYAVISADI